MSTLSEAARDFLAQERIAVAGVSRSGELPANYIYRKLRDTGHKVFAVNPNAESVEGDACYARLEDIPGGVNALMIATHPRVATELVNEAAATGVHRVWMHRSFGDGSVSDEAVRLCTEKGIAVIPGSCPMMFCEPIDFPHKCIHFLTHLFANEPSDSDATEYFAKL